ncbi:MAG: tRNA (adenosine(37)-N6)-threonylcarbamoyltransferase complex dimerization subunit type 1 TsaB [bacterium]|nr:tRNA (adenosine(37)-N6)-threonylcarbamoyltransferase complex dimerization subunit type 1 TsaB [bacterium]
MNMLAFDTCLDKTYITLFNGKEFKNKVILSNDENYHSAYLISTIVEILKEENLTPRDLDCICTDIGPGSFTGIRACTTVARMLAQQLNIKVIGVSSLEILSGVNDGNNLVALDARKNKAYVYDGKILGAIELEEVDKIVEGRVLVTDNNLYERFNGKAKRLVSYQKENYELGEILAKLALEKLENNAETNWGSLKPLYIQPPPVFGK